MIQSSGVKDICLVDIHLEAKDLCWERQEVYIFRHLDGPNLNEKQHYIIFKSLNDDGGKKIISCLFSIKLLNLLLCKAPKTLTLMLFG